MIRKSVAEILKNHVTFELEAIDRMYLNAYLPSLQTGAGFVYFLKTQLGVRVPSTTMVAPMSERFVTAIERFVETEGVDLVTFKKGERKDAVAQEYLARFPGDEGVLFVGKARERPASSAPRSAGTRRGRPSLDPQSVRGVRGRRDGKNRTVPAGFDVNGEETWKWTWLAEARPDRPPEPRQAWRPESRGG